MWEEGIELAQVAYALETAYESGDTDRLTELATRLARQVRDEVSAQAEAGGWYEEYDRLTEPDVVSEAVCTYADVKVEEAAWAYEAPDGRQAVAECHLCDDEESPWGGAFDFTGHVYDAGKREWVEEDGGRFWGYQNADDPELEAMATGSCGIPCNDGDFRRIDHTLLDEIGVGVFFSEGHHARPLKKVEIERSFEGGAAPAPCADGCDLELESHSAREASGATASRGQRDVEVGR